MSKTPTAKTLDRAGKSEKGSADKEASLARARASMSTIDVWCRFDEAKDVTSLIENPRNPNKHPDKQIALLAKIIRNQGWRQPITVSKRSGFIVKGHGRLQAAKVLNVEQVPVEFQDYATEADEYADLIADNRIAELAEPDAGMLAELLNDELFKDFDMELTGFDGDALGELMDDAASGADNTYTNKIVAPVYEPKGENPPIISLIDRSKTDALQAEIKAAGLPDDVEGFLIDAAERHTVFHFGRIAEWYCHATPAVQELMEKSGMVIIDFKKAIEYGFVHLTERLGALADLEKDEGESDA